MNTRPAAHRTPIFCTLAALAMLYALSARAETDYLREIKPLLQVRCYECHGVLKQKSGLRLDTVAFMRKGGENGSVVKTEKSLLLERITSTDKDERMPPAGPPLSTEQIAALKAWIAAGAIGPPDEAPQTDPREHWAFKPLRDVDKHFTIDYMILDRLLHEGLAFSPPADKRTLIRRATFDLTGLPPTSDEVEAFTNDASPDAFAKLVEHLLASPRYGEHWARHWLDVARYSDTKGYVYAREEKNWVHAWPYRDWVVRALNQDMPYDRFLMLQIAADQLEPAQSPDLAAMGFLTLGRRFLGVTHDIIDDRIDVVMRGTQALTVACARCHDHKFDPIPTRDYYSLYGVFQSCTEQLVPCGKSAPPEAFVKELNKREAKLRETMAKRRDEQAARNRATIAEHLLAQFELEKYPEEVFNQILSPNDINPAFVRKWQAYLVEAAKRDDPIFKPWRAYAKLDGAAFAIEAKKITEALRAEKINPLVAKAFSTPPENIRDVAARYAKLFGEIEKQWRKQLEIDKTATALPDADAEALRQVLYAPDSPCVVPDEPIVNSEMYFATSIIEEMWKLQGEVDRWLIQSGDAPAYATILTDRAKPSEPRVFKRGNPMQKGEEVSRHYVQILAGENPKPFTKGSGRLELAQAITDPRNPLTARVMVNRVWQQHFGRGLVTSPSEFGNRAAPPSHPDLLDWLAKAFIDDGWSLKRLHRRIMLSACYQQSSFGDRATLAKAQERDPENKLLWRMNTHRLSFEEMRDSILSATGEIDARIGGKPAELFAEKNLRRTLYANVDRERLNSTLCTFDFANPDLSIAQRADTIVPQQALFGLNHPFMAARAKALVKRVDSLKPADDAARIQQMYAFLLQRKPTSAELNAALAFIRADTQPIAKPDKPNAWRYGYGEFDEPSGRMKNFTALPHFTGTAWQGGSKWPDVKLGWAQLTATGGHPGNDLKHAVARRWTAPQDGAYSIASTLNHEPTEGDGIRAFISHSASGLLRSAKIHHASEALNVNIAMKAGETLDFVVDIAGGLNSDQFLWSPKISLANTAGTGVNPENQSWDAQAEFAGPTKPTPLNVWEQLAQTLMLTNEFLFVD